MRGDMSRSISPALIARIKDAAVLRMSDPLLGTRLGWLVMSGDITSAQAAAGFQFACIFDEYARVKGFPRRSAASPSFEFTSPGEAGDVPEDVVRRVSSIYEGLRDTLQGVGVLQDLISVCVDDNAPLGEELRRVKRGLTLLVEYFEFGKARGPRTKRAREALSI